MNYIVTVEPQFQANDEGPKALPDVKQPDNNLEVRDRYKYLNSALELKTFRC